MSEDVDLRNFPARKESVTRSRVERREATRRRRRPASSGRWRRLWPVLLCPLVAGVVAYVYGSTLTPTYRATGEIAIVPPSAQQLGPDTPGVDTSAATAASLARSWADEIPRFAYFQSRVAQLAGGNATQASVGGAVTAENSIGSNVIVISAKASTARNAQSLGRAAVGVFLVQVRHWTGHPAQARVLARVHRPANPISPDLRANTAVGVVLGFIIGISALFLARRPLIRPRADRQPNASAI